MSPEHAILAIALVLTLSFAHQATNKDCDYNVNCTTANAICYNNSTCLCDDGYISIIVNTTHFNCIKAAEKIGDNCKLDVQCEKPLGLLAYCAHHAAKGEGTCSCKYGSHHKQGTCYKSSRIGDRCDYNNNCRIQSQDIKSYCFEKHCICPPGYYGANNGTDCQTKSKLNGACSSDESCAELNAICRGICLCKSGYVLNSEQDKCLLAAQREGQTCYEDSQCKEYLRYSVCDQFRNRCICKVRLAHERDGQCYKSVRLHGGCSERAECRVDSRIYESVDCVGNICRCTADYISNGTDCILLPKPAVNNAARTSLFLAYFLVVFSLLLKKLIKY